MTFINFILLYHKLNRLDNIILNLKIEKRFNELTNKYFVHTNMLKTAIKLRSTARKEFKKECGL